MAESTKKTQEIENKAQKYDRQLRLWGEHGQTALEGAHVCLINATTTGTEILKSLVLPGIGSVTLVDGNKVTGEDAGNNFFLDRESIGRSRAQTAVRLLLEMNSDVKGDFVEESPEQLLENNPTFFQKFSVVVATNLTEQTLLELSKKLWEYGVPLLVCKTYGMIGYIRLQVKEHVVIESHPDAALSDLRLDRPFPQMLNYLSTIEFENTDRKAHSHIPYLAIILKYLQEWKRTHETIPKGYKEKEEFKNLIRSGIWKKTESGDEDEENFEEAVKAVNSVLVHTTIPSNIKNIFNSDSCNNLTADSKPFWIMVNAVKQFVENEGKGALPVQGSIPDMTADSERYIRLQNVYKGQARIDMEVVQDYVQKTLQQFGKPQDYVTESELILFCKNAYFLEVINGRTIQEEYNPKTARLQDILMNIENPESEMTYYCLLRAVDKFYFQYNRYPGVFNDQVEPDVVKLKSCLGKVLQDLGCGPMPSKDDYVHEMCRFGASELHSVAAFIAGIAAQEVIKILTCQYVPVNNTYLYNAMTSTSSTFEL